MTYLHIHDQGSPRYALGERRFDHATAQNVHDALRGRGLSAVAQAMACQRVGLAVALRLLASHAARRRGIDEVATAAARPDFVAMPA